MQFYTCITKTINKMKKITLSFMIVMLSLIAFPTASFAVSNSSTVNTTVPTEVPAKVQALFDRLDDIKKIDKSEMTRFEKKALRKEVRAIKAELRTTNNGVYLSIGAIIIIVLVLILLL